MRVVGIIPARYASSRFEGKALALIEGKPLIRHVYERAVSSRCLSELVIATDDARILAEAQRFGARAILTSPAHTCGTERVAEAASGMDADIVVNLQGDELLSAGEMIDECVGALPAGSQSEASTLGSEITNERELADPNVVKVVTDLEGRALLFSRSPIPNTRYATNPGNVRFLRHVGIYAYGLRFLGELVKLERTPLELAESLEQLRILEHGRRMRVVVTRHSSLGVDVPSDIDKARSFLASLEEARS